jgi:hypothetical protein
MTTEAIDNLLTRAEAFVAHMTRIAQSIQSLQKAHDNCEFTDQQLERWQKMKDTIDRLEKSGFP